MTRYIIFITIILSITCAAFGMRQVPDKYTVATNNREPQLNDTLEFVAADPLPEKDAELSSIEQIHDSADPGTKDIHTPCCTLSPEEKPSQFRSLITILSAAGIMIALYRIRTKKYRTKI